VMGVAKTEGRQSWVKPGHDGAGESIISAPSITWSAADWTLW
jgi:hypothetical protein